MAKETKAELMFGLSDQEKKTAKIVANNTIKYTRENGDVVTRLHSTDIIVQHPDGSKTYNSGGWQTSTTKQRMFVVNQVKGKWYIAGHDFYDGITIAADGKTVLDKVEVEKGPSNYHRIDGWRGYEWPKLAVAGSSDTGSWSDSPAPSALVSLELNRLKEYLAEHGFSATETFTQSSNVFMIKRWLVVKKGYDEAKKLAEDWLEQH